MKFSVGDKIKLRKTGEEGEVVEIILDEYLRVRIGGVIIPAEEADLDFPYLDWFLKIRAEEKKKKTLFIDNIKVDKSEQSAESLFAPGVYLLFQPVYREHEGEDLIHRFVMYLFSEWHKSINYLVDISIGGKNIFAFEGALKFQQRQLLFSLPFDDAGDNPVFNFEIKEQTKGPAFNHNFSFKLSRKKLIQEVQRLENENLALFEIPIFTELASAKKLALPVMGAKATALTMLGTPRPSTIAKAEIDLHIEKIEKHHARMTNAEKLTSQLNYFQLYLDVAMANEDINPLRVIHGIGEGILRKEIYTISQQIPAVREVGPDHLNPGVTLIYF